MHILRTDLLGHVSYELLFPVLLLLRLVLYGTSRCGTSSSRSASSLFHCYGPVRGNRLLHAALHQRLHWRKLSVGDSR